jgi:hypothetical protein
MKKDAVCQRADVSSCPTHLTSVADADSLPAPSSDVGLRHGTVFYHIEVGMSRAKLNVMQILKDPK